MKFSIIVPVYNTERYIGACIESVLNQPYENYEIILVDDGSTDNSGTICDEYSKKDSRIRTFHKENSGQIEARCLGIAKSNGDCLIFLDSDDLLAENALEIMNNKFEKYQCDMLIFSWKRFFEQPDAVHTVSGVDDIIITEKKTLYKTIFSTEKYNGLSIKAIKKEFVRLKDYTKWKNVRYGEDLLQTVDIIAQNPKTVIIPDILYFYRTHATSLTQSLRIERYASDIVFVRNVVYEFLMCEQVFTPEEWDSYREIAIRLMAEGVSRISCCKEPSTKKIELLNKIKENTYYKTFLNCKQYDKSSLGNKRIVWFLFQNNFYRLLFLIFTLKKRINKW